MIWSKIIIEDFLKVVKLFCLMTDEYILNCRKTVQRNEDERKKQSGAEVGILFIET